MKASISTLMSLKGRTALVTGASGHLGSVIVETLAELGSDIFVVDKNEEILRTSFQPVIDKYGVKIYPIVADLLNENALSLIHEEVCLKVSKLDILVNNAAFVGTSELSGWAVDFKKQTKEAWELAMHVNLTAPFFLAQIFADMLKCSRAASIINIGSIYGVVAPDMRLYDDLPMGNPGAYAASKSGLIHITRWLASVFAPQVRVNSISPGGIWRNQPELFCERYNSKTLLNRMATEEDLKGAVMYLASDLSSYVTGQNIIVDGGFTTI